MQISQSFSLSRASLLVVFNCILFVQSCKAIKSWRDSVKDSSTESSGGEEEDEISEFSLGNPDYFPKDALEISLKRILLANRQPKFEKIRDCADELFSLTAESGDVEAMKSQAAAFDENISDKPEFYHWCFFQLIDQMRATLDSDGRSYTAKAKFFVEKMRHFWVLARALDEDNEEGPYHAYLQATYIQLSNYVFGRDVEPLYFSKDNPFLDSPQNEEGEEGGTQ